MGYKFTTAQFDGVLAALQKDYDVYAPVLSAKNGDGTARYGRITQLAEMVLHTKAAFSPKEVFYPVVQTMLHFTGDRCRQSDFASKGLIIFARPCDINGIRRLDAIFLRNGASEDVYYARRRAKVKLLMLECLQGDDACFCVSMGANKTVDYDAALRFSADGALADVKDTALESFFAAGAACDFTPRFIGQNSKQVTIPQIKAHMLPDIHQLEMWRDYDEKCLSCGGCNAVCVTCGCFDTADIIYDETSLDGERRRLWGSCMREDFTVMAGGHSLRKTPGQRMRFKVLHKVYDFKARFGAEHMCVGCGRCDSRCPAGISFAGAVNRLSTVAAGLEANDV